jgi:hypothetical protein
LNRETKRRAKGSDRPPDGCGGQPLGIMTWGLSRPATMRTAAAFAALLLLLCAPILRAQAILGTTSGDTNALAINSNNSPGLAYNALLNSDSSVSLLQDGAILSGEGCAPYMAPSSSSSLSVSSGAVYVDFANSRIYLAMIAGGAVYAAYESINQTAGTCTPGPLLQLTTNAQSNLEINVDPVQGNVYILNSFGAFPDTLYILPIASWSASSATELNMDYSAQYGPIVIDPSNHQVYVNDLGGSAYGAAGTYSTSGFFVYDPNYSATPANNLQHVVGYKSGGTTTILNVGTLLDNGTGKLVLINENPNASTVNLAVPITILDTTQFSFFSNTSYPNTYNSDVDITPGTGLSTISATSPYTAIGGADINAANSIAYVFGFNSNSPTTPGMLLEYNLFSTEGSPETVLSSSAAMPSLYSSLAPWNQLNFNPESTELVLSVGSQYGSGALGLTSPLCAGPPFSLTQLFGSSLAPTPLGYAVVNSDSGYTYAIQPGSGNPPGPSIVNFVAPPSGGCSASPPIQISPTALYAGFPNESYFQNFTASGGSGTGYVWSITFGGTALTNLGLSFSSGGDLSGYPNASGSYSFTVQVTDSLGNTASENLTLTIYADFTVLPSSLPAGTVGTPYSQMFTATGGAGGPFSFSVISGTALTAVNLSLSSAGLISGTPNATETAAPLTIQVVDSLGDNTELNYTLTINSATSTPAQVTDNEIITVSDTETFPDVVDSEKITVTDIETVRAYNAIAITPSAASFNASSGAGYATYAYAPVTFIASGGTGTLTLTETGTLPSGITFSNGVLSGTPATSSVGSSYPFSVTATDAFGDSVTLNGYTLTIQAASAYPATVMDNETITVTDTETVKTGPIITGPASLPAGNLNVAYTATTITASGGSGAYIWSETGLPTGLGIGSGTGTISGTPTTDAGSPYSVTVTVEDSTGNTAKMTYFLAVGSSLAITGPSSLPNGDVGEAYTSTTITANGGLPPYIWSATGLPAGLSIDIATGIISGTPTADAGSPYSVTVTVEDSTGSKANKNYSITVALPSVTVSANPGNITIVQGQSGQSTLTFTPQGNYTGTFTLSVSGLPSNTSDVFTLNGVSVTSVTLTGNNQTVNVVLTINSDVSSTQARTQSAPTSPRRGAILTAIVFWCPGSLLGLIALRRKRKLFTKNPGIFGLCVVVLLAGTLAGLAGCISGGGFGTYVTPAGSSTVTVVATPGAGSPQTVNIGLTITQQ